MKFPPRLIAPATRGLASRPGVMAVAFLLMCGCEQTSWHRKPRRPENPPDALQTVNKKMTADQSTDVKLALARSLESQGELKPAGDFYKQILEKEPKRVDVMTRLAVLHDRRGEFGD